MILKKEIYIHQKLMSAGFNLDRSFIKGMDTDTYEMVYIQYEEEQNATKT